ncbi:MAG: carboxylesterase family protein [Gammaproteobacteria bacterium]|nr:carboxylesterase family protein [Gammaproteobacteria bacterium]
MRIRGFIGGLAISLVAMSPSTTASDTDTIQAGEDLAVVATASGSVRGYISSDIFTFKGIRYARAERFLPPEPPEPWDETPFMGYYGATCPFDAWAIAARGNGVGMFALQNDWGYPSEDCLSLNVWTSSIDDDIKRPVMVWIHGGGWDFGSSHELPFYDGENLARNHDVVLVSVNHRLNILGFLDLSAHGEKYQHSGNVGLLDLVAALEWVRNNVAQFGGDPDNVTLFGQSGGGSKITALLNSPFAKDLFHRAVVQSGSFATEYRDKAVAQRVGTRVLKELGINPDEADAIQDVSYPDLLEAGKVALAGVAEELAAENRQTGGFGRIGWGPVTDPDVLPHGVFSAGSIPYSLDKPIMIGSTKHEFSLFAGSQVGDDMDAARAAVERIYGEQTDEYMEAMQTAYPETVKASDYLDIDLGFRRGVVRDATALAEGGHENVYVYLFAWESPVNDGGLKSMHCMELPFVFDNIEHGKEITGGSKDARVLAETVSGAWTNFARHGNPAADGLPTWPAYTVEGGETMIINDVSRVGRHHDAALLKLARAPNFGG